MTHPAIAQTPQDWRARLDALPLLLSDGRPLAETLAAETTLTPDQAARVVLAYRQFLALQAEDPSLLPPQLIGLAAWCHRNDGAAWQRFCADWPAALALPPLPRRPPPARQTHAAAAALVARTGQSANPQIWPQPMMWFRDAPIMALLIASLALLGMAEASGYRLAFLLPGVFLAIGGYRLVQRLWPLTPNVRGDGPNVPPFWIDTDR